MAFFAKEQASPHAAGEPMKRAIVDSARGRRIYSLRIAIVQSVLANIRRNRRKDRFTLRGEEKVGTQRRRYCFVHNIEKPASDGYHVDKS